MRPGPNAGRRGHTWRELRRRVLVAAGGVCAICRQRTCPKCGARACGGSTPPGHVDHLVPVSVRPDLAEDIRNLRAAHGCCNRQRGAAMDSHPAGGRSTRW